MSLVLDDRTQGLWFVEMPGGDWAAQLEAREGGGFRIRYRFRWYRDAKAFDSQDERHQWRVESAAGLDEGIEAVRMIVRVMQSKGAGKATELLRGNLSTRDYLDLIRHQTFVHTQTVSLAEFEAKFGQEAAADLVQRAGQKVVR